MLSTSSRADDAPPKATFFCPDCGHQSQFDGDWTVTETARGDHYRCPECETVITVLPRTGRAAGPGALWGRTVRTWLDSVETWQGLWYDTVLPS